MKYLKVLLCIAVVVTIASCNPLNKKYSQDHFPDDIVAIAKSKQLDTADLMSLTMYIAGAKITGASLDGKTYQEMLNDIKEIRKKEEAREMEEKMLAEKAKKEEQERAARLDKTLTVALFDKGYQEDEYGIEKYLTYKIAFDNKSDKDIKAVKGSLLITDLFDVKITSIEITYDNGIKANSTIKESYHTRYNGYEEKDTELREKDMQNLKVIWLPEKIIFADGTTLD